MGLGQKAIVPLNVDKYGALQPECLATVFEQVRDQGKCPIALVANACSTAVGVYDPLDPIGDFCQAHDLWLHVDGAHGASALLSEKHRVRLLGIEKADSVTWDAHKLLQTSVLCAALLVRDHRRLDSTFQQEASYLFHAKEQPGFDFIQRTIECTKAGLGLKLFLVLAAMGEKGLANTIDRQYELAVQAYTWIREQEGFTCPVAPQSNILCFRIDGSDTLQIQIRDRLIAEGRFYISSTCFQGLRYLRLALMNPQTQLSHIQELIETIRRHHTGIVQSDNKPA
jgi:L-2,4-diaminobutyrate decarboxylase